MKGPPTVFGTKRAAVAQFESWERLAHERLRAMMRANPGAILTAVGVIVH